MWSYSWGTDNDAVTAIGEDPNSQFGRMFGAVGDQNILAVVSDAVLA